MPEIIWCGNKSWDTDFPENAFPDNAKLIERPDNIFKSSILYDILPLIFSYAIISIKWFIIDERAMNPIYVPLGIIPLAIFLLSPPNAFLSGICIPIGDYWYAFSDAGLYGCPYYLQTSTQRCFRSYSK